MLLLLLLLLVFVMLDWIEDKMASDRCACAPADSDPCCDFMCCFLC